MNIYKLTYENKEYDIVSSNSAKDLVKEYDLASKKHINTTIEDITNETIENLTK